MLSSTYTVRKPGSLRVWKQTMMSIAILVLEYCKHKHGQVRGFCTILTKITDVAGHGQGTSRSEKFSPNTECLR